MKYLKIVLFPSPFSRWSHSIVLKSLPLIIGIVYRILKITSEQLFPFNESELSHSANCRYNLRLFRLFRGDSSGMDKSSSAKCLLYSDVVKGKLSPTRTGRTKKKPWWKRQSRSCRFSFDKYFTNPPLLSLLFSFICLRYWVMIQRP